MPPCEDTCLLKELSRTRRSQGHVRASALPVADLLASVCRPRSYLLGGLTILIPYFYLFLKSSLAMSGLCSCRATASENGTCLANGIGAEAATAPRCGVSAPAASHWGVVVTTKNTSTAYKNCEKNYCMFTLSNGHCDLPVATPCMSSLRGRGFEEQSRGNVPPLGRGTVLGNGEKHEVD